MERRVLLAIFLSFAVLFAYQSLVVPPPVPGNVSAPPPGVTQPIAPAQSGGLSPGPGTVAAPVAPPQAVPLVVGDSEEREIVIETQKARAVFTNRGARLRHWILKEYKDDAGNPLDLVPAVVPPTLALPFSLRIDDQAASARLNDSLYKVSGVSGTHTDATAQSASVTFELETADGLKARKVFTFEPKSFIVNFSADVMRGTETLNPIVEGGPGLGDDIARTQPGSFLSPNYMYLAQAIYHTHGDVEREAGTGLGAGVVREGTFRWAGVDDHYFIHAVLQPPAPTRLEFLPVAIPTMGTPPQVGQYVAWGVRYPASPQNVRYYLGPKKLDEMRDIDPEFTRAIYFGMFALLAAPLLEGLRWVYSWVGDWGWSIIVLTIMINLVMAPLRHKSVVSMRKMQGLQPQMKAIQDRYAKYKVTDPERQKMNSEVMELYRSKGVNPASGCVPMLLTLPFLFAFYAMLGQAIEIRGEPFFWIRDLARLDPLYITPALMGLTMFWQQKITPTTADPTQQKIMMFMPIMITATMLFAPSGLVIYWLISNVWAIGQQYFTNAMIGPPDAPGSKAKDSRSLKDIVVEKSNTKNTKSAKKNLGA
ncbi:MAG TPA: membrane protein insertase YidC [Vicinamibacterales bacterium]|nr:membrane protein insertase YidC [Vicinamibacterales bacterium]